MEDKIKLIAENGETGSIEHVNKLQAEQKILEIFETKEIESISVIYKKEPAHYEYASLKPKYYL